MLLCAYQQIRFCVYIQYITVASLAPNISDEIMNIGKCWLVFYFVPILYSACPYFHACIVIMLYPIFSTIETHYQSGRPWGSPKTKGHILFRWQKQMRHEYLVTKICMVCPCAVFIYNILATVLDIIRSNTLFSFGHCVVSAVRLLVVGLLFFIYHNYR